MTSHSQQHLGTKLNNLKLLTPEETITSDRCDSNTTSFNITVRANYSALKNDVTQVIEKVMRYAKTNKHQYPTELIPVSSTVTIPNQNTNSNTQAECPEAVMKLPQVKRQTTQPPMK